MKHRAITRGLILCLSAAFGGSARAGCQEAGATQAQSHVPAYPDSERGLKRFVEEVLDAARKDARQAMFDSLNTFLLQEHEDWFRATFGDETGSKLAHVYQQEKKTHVIGLADAFSYAVRQHMMRLEIVSFEKDCSIETRSEQFPILMARGRKALLYEVRLIGGKGQVPLWFFAFIDGSFRYLGKLSMLASSGTARTKADAAIPREADHQTARRVRIGGNVQAARLIERRQANIPANCERVSPAGHG